MPVAIEVQISNLTQKPLPVGPLEYLRLGYTSSGYSSGHLPEPPGLQQPRRFERWLHATYYGRVYFWEKDSRSYRTGSRERDLRRALPLARQLGKEAVQGGYRRPSKRFKHATEGRHRHVPRFPGGHPPGTAGAKPIHSRSKTCFSTGGGISYLRDRPVPSLNSQ